MKIKYLPGYDGQLYLGPLIWLLVRLMVALYLLASALARYDLGPLSGAESLIRLGLAAGLMFSNPYIHGPILVAAVGLLAFQFTRQRALA